MRVCFVVNELFHWGLYGGFGALTRTVGRQLVKRGIEVYVVMPQSSKHQRLIEPLDGMIVLSVPSKFHWFTMLPSFRSRSLFKRCEADIYHSQEPSPATWMAIRTNPEKEHVITFQDPMTLDEFRTLWTLTQPNLSYFSRRLLISLRTENYFTSKAVRRADAVFCQAKFIIPKVTSMYNLKRQPNFLPNPVSVPERTMKKADEPTVCFLARWDPVKRPEIFFELARRFPSVRFIAMGKAHNEEKDRYLRKRCNDIPNLTCPGFVTEEEKSKILEKSWIYINTSIRECLPLAFLEAAAHKCAILSSENPDDFAENFGYRVTDGSLIAYVKRLKFLLKDDCWKEKGEKSFKYVKEVHEINHVIDQHIDIYNKLLLTDEA